MRKLFSPLNANYRQPYPMPKESKPKKQKFLWRDKIKSIKQKMGWVFRDGLMLSIVFFLLLVGGFLYVGITNTMKTIEETNRIASTWAIQRHGIQESPCSYMDNELYMCKIRIPDVLNQGFMSVTLDIKRGIILSSVKNEP